MSAPMPSPSLDCLTQAQFARRMQYSERKVDALIAEKAVGHIKDGRSVRIPVQAALDFMLSRTVRAVRPAGAGPERLAAEDAELLWQRIERLVERILESKGPSRTGHQSPKAGRLADMEAAA